MLTHVLGLHANRACLSGRAVVLLAVPGVLFEYILRVYLFATDSLHKFMHYDCSTVVNLCFFNRFVAVNRGIEAQDF